MPCEDEEWNDAIERLAIVFSGGPDERSEIPEAVRPSAVAKQEAKDPRGGAARGDVDASLHRRGEPAVFTRGTGPDAGQVHRVTAGLVHVA